MSDGPRIYLLPNLMTAGNLFCGFASILRIVEGTLLQANAQVATGKFHEAIWFILAACVFDLLDGRVARFGGQESPFGREFDSIADIVSFGVAPALLVYQIILREYDWAGKIIAFLYLCCGALRLARFNCIAAEDSKGANREFTGFPIPAAAGVISSVTLTMIWLDGRNFEFGRWRIVLPILMVFLSVMMFSKFAYPSFKALGWKTQRSIPMLVFIILLISITVTHYQWMPTLIFIVYLLYGFLRPWLSRAWRRQIETQLADEAQEEEDAPVD